MKQTKPQIISMLSSRAISFARALEKTCCSYDEEITPKHLLVQISVGEDYWSRLK